MEFLEDSGSALDADRKGFRRLLDLVVDREVSAVIVAYREVLIRGGFDVLERLFFAFGTRIEAVDHRDRSPPEELEGDFMKVAALFIGKLSLGSHHHEGMPPPALGPYRYKEMMEGIRRLLS